MAKSMSRDKKVTKKSAFSISALPYRLQILMPTSSTSSGKKAMRDIDFKNRCDNCSSYREFMMRFLMYLRTIKLDELSNSGIRVDFNQAEQRVENELRFVIRAGHYGYSSELQNVKKSKGIKTREVDDCELLPYCCRIVFSTKQDSAIIIFEKFGVNSVVTIFKDALREYVKTVAFKGDCYYDAVLMSIVNKRYLEEKFRNSVRAVHFVRHARVGDLADFLHGESSAEKRVKVKMSIVADRGMVLNLLDQFNPLKSDNFAGIEIDNQKYDEMRLELKSGKRTQTVSFNDDMFAIAFDLTDKVCVRKDGHPDPDMFFTKTDECLKMSKETIAWED